MGESDSIINLGEESIKTIGAESNNNGCGQCIYLDRYCSPGSNVQYYNDCKGCCGLTGYYIYYLDGGCILFMSFCDKYKLR